MSVDTNSNIRYKKISDPVFNRTVHFIVGDHVHAKMLLSAKLGVSHLPSLDSDGESVLTSQGHIILWMHKYEHTAHCDAVLAHEIFHTTKNVMDYVGVVLTDDSEETYAHYVGYLMHSIKKFLNKK